MRVVRDDVGNEVGDAGVRTEDGCDGGVSHRENKVLGRQISSHPKVTRRYST